MTILFQLYFIMFWFCLQVVEGFCAILRYYCNLPMCIYSFNLHRVSQTNILLRLKKTHNRQNLKKCSYLYIFHILIVAMNKIMRVFTSCTTENHSTKFHNFCNQLSNSTRAIIHLDLFLYYVRKK